MKIQFSDKSYIECKKSDLGKIIMIVSAKDYDNPLKRITNTVELTMDEFKQLISDIT
jgi:hypothetical protein